MPALLAIPPPLPVPGTEKFYQSGSGDAIGRVFQLPDGSWRAEPTVGLPSEHVGPMARWDASHRLTLAYMRSRG